jgi:fatty-acyl-CoA synthase
LPAGYSLGWGGDFENLLSASRRLALITPVVLGLIAMLLYTSGTTGRPKGVVLPHRQLFWNAVNTVWATDLGPSDRALACLPLFHTGGLNCLATPTLYRGGTVLLMEAFDAGLALQVAEATPAEMWLHSGALLRGSFITDAPTIAAAQVVRDARRGALQGWGT